MPHFMLCGTETAEVIACEFFPADGRVEQRQVITVSPNELGLENGAPGGIAVEWVVWHPSGNAAYALISHWDNAPGAIRTLTVSASGELALTGELVSTGGYQPCHAFIDGTHLLMGALCESNPATRERLEGHGGPDHSFASFSAHYLSGNVSVVDVSDMLQPKLLQSAPMPDMRTGGPTPHAEPFKACGVHGSVPGERSPLCHGIATSPAGNWLVAGDAGQTMIVTWAYDRKSSTPLQNVRSQAAPTPTPVGENTIVGPPSNMGHRPRHVAFNADGTRLFIVHEFNNVITMHEFDPSTADLGPALATMPTFPYDAAALPAGFFHGAAEVALHRSGKLFVSTRGFIRRRVHDTSNVRAFSIDGELAVAQDVTTLKNPRTFTFDA